MTLKEAYEIIYEEKSSNKSEKEIRKKIKNEELKKRYRDLMKKHHPDKLGDTEKSQEINNAYDFLKKYLKENQYEMIIDEYKVKFRKARDIYSYETTSKIIKLIKECEEKEKYTISIEEAYQIVKETKQNIIELKNNLEKIAEVYSAIRKKLQTETLTKEELEDLLVKFANEYYHKLDDPKYKDAMDFWYKEELNVAYNRFERLMQTKAHIIAPRINNAKNLYLYILENESIEFVHTISKEFDKQTDLTNKMLLLKYFQDKMYEQDRLIRKCNLTYIEYQERTKIQKEEIDDRYIKEMEDIFLRLIPEEHLNKVLNEKELSQERTYNQKHKENYAIEKEDLEAKVNYYKEDLIEEIKSKTAEINYIKFLINENTKKYDCKNLSKNSSIENLLSLDCDLDTQLSIYKEKAIKKYYEAFIYHYIEILNSNAVPEEITSLYKEALKQKENPNMIDKYYKIFKKEYNKLYNESHKAITKDKTASPNEEEIQMLKRNIKQKINYYSSNDGKLIFNIPEDKKKEIDSKFQNINDLSVEELYNLYAELDNIFAGRYKEIKFK